MNIVAEYDFNGGKAVVQQHYSAELAEIMRIIQSVDATTYKTKRSKEATMQDKMLYSSMGLNKAFKESFLSAGWSPSSIPCHYGYGTPINEYETLRPAYKRPEGRRGRCYREMDFLKSGKKLGVEVQFGKYAFMAYDICVKMIIFKNKEIIDTGIEIVPVKHLAREMSTGVAYFEQFAWDLHMRGVSNIDVPVLILGVDV